MSELYLAHKLLTEEKIEGLPHLQAELIREWEQLQAELASIKQQVVFVDEGEGVQVGDVVIDYETNRPAYIIDNEHLGFHTESKIIQRAGKPALVRK